MKRLLKFGWVKLLCSHLPEGKISPEELSHTDILSRLNMSPRRYYRLRDQAIRIRLCSAGSCNDA